MKQTSPNAVTWISQMQPRLCGIVLPVVCVAPAVLEICGNPPERVELLPRLLTQRQGTLMMLLRVSRQCNLNRGCNTLLLLI